MPVLGIPMHWGRQQDRQQYQQTRRPGSAYRLHRFRRNFQFETSSIGDRSRRRDGGDPASACLA